MIAAHDEPLSRFLVDRRAGRDVAAMVNAHTKLPIIEIVIAASVLYGLHLIVTRGVKRSSRKIEYHADGSYTETSTTEYYAPAAAFRLAAGARDSDSNQVSERSG